MPLPELNKDGILPPGVHGSTTEEVRDRFCWNDRRVDLFLGLSAFLGVLREDFSEPVVIDGSFVTDLDNPSDVDVILDMTGATPARAYAALQYCNKNRAAFKTKFKIDLWPNLPSGDDFNAFFQYVGVKTAAMKGLREKDRKGIIGIV